MVGKPAEILLIEDDMADIELIKECLKKFQNSIHLNAVVDGEEGLKFLNFKGTYQEAMRPDLILLDLNMPKKDGQQILFEIRRDHKFRTIPIVILTTSEFERDIEAAYKLGANCFITKPFDFQEFCHAIDMICKFWLKISVPSADS